MKSLTITYRGQTYQLVQHPRDVAAGRRGDWYFRLPSWLHAQRPLRRVGPSGSDRDAAGRTADAAAQETVLAWLAAGPAGPGAVAHRLDLLRAEFSTMSAADFRAAVETWLGHTRALPGAVPLAPLGELITAYIEAGCPDPHLRPRTGRALYQEGRALERARAFWELRNAHTIEVPRDTDAYHATRTAQARASGRGEGHRAVDNELGTLRNCLSWAVRTGRLTANRLADPSRPVPTYHHPDDVVHCASKTVSTDEELHLLLAHLFSRPATAVSGARVAFGALTGLRPGEPTFLRWDDRPAEAATSLERPGHCAPYLREGRPGRKLLVAREKGGINPAIEIHPALASFLAHWRAYCAEHFPGSPWMFPDPARPDLPACRRSEVAAYWAARGVSVPPGGVGTNSDQLSLHLRAAASACQLGHVVPHGLRAYYVSVRRSQGIADCTIGDELGHTGGAKLIIQVYGSPEQVFGLGTLDWLPAGAAPAWQSLTPRAENVVSLKIA